MRILLSCLVFILLPVAGQAERYLLAVDGTPAFASVRPMSNGVSSVALVWPLPDRSEEAIQALRAAIWTRLTMGDGSRAPVDNFAYLDESEVRLSVWARGDNIVLQVSAPHDFFESTVDWLAATLRNPNWNADIYARERARVTKVPASKLRRPDDVLDAISNHVLFDLPQQSTSLLGPLDKLELHVGMPVQMIMRTELEDVESLARTLAFDLPRGETPVKVSGGIDFSAFAPGRVIYVPDPDSSEMLVQMLMLVPLNDAVEMQKARILFDYMGLHQGSEMFRILRQEMRMAYDPRSDVKRLSRTHQLMSLSATVAAERWPQAIETMHAIYARARNGDMDLQGVETTIERVTRQVNGSFAARTGWFAEHFLDAYPKGASDRIQLPLLAAFAQITAQDVIAGASQTLPPPEDFMVVLIGGGPDPKTVLGSSDICRLDLNTFLRDCLQ